MSELKYRPDIDGLRAVAVTLVLLFHGGLGFPGGFVGVDVFFVISGYLITGLILKELQSGTFQFRTFFARRIRRILPACAVMVAVTLIVGFWMLFPADYEDLALSTVFQQLMASNVYFWRTINYFNDAADQKPLLHTWSLAVEEQFYLVYPILLMVLGRFSRRTIAIVLGVLMLGSLGLSQAVVLFRPRIAFYLLPMRAWELLIGGLLWFLPQRLQIRSYAAGFLGFAGILAIFLASIWFDTQTQFPGISALLPCAGAAMIMAAGRYELVGISRVLAWKPIVFVGLISYSLYLWHWPLLAYARYWSMASHALSTTSIILLLGLSVILACFSWRFVETPLRRKSALGGSSRIIIGLCATIPVFSGLAMVIAMNKGLPSRYPRQAVAFFDAMTSSPDRHELSVEDINGLRIPEFGDTHGAIKCLIWGDSHAMALVAGLDAACRAKGVHGFQVTRSSTPPFLDYKNQSNDLVAEGPAFGKAAFDFAVNNKIDYIVLSGRWSMYINHPRFETLLRKTIDELRHAGIRVVIVLDVADQEFRVPQALARQVLRGQSTSSIGCSDQRYQTLNYECNAIIRNVAEGKAQVLDPAPNFVDALGFWPGEIGGKAMYWDNNHLSKEGSLRLSGSFEEIFKAIDDKILEIQP